MENTESNVSNEIGFREIFSLVVRNKNILLLTVIISTILVVSYSRLLSEKFTAHSTILIEQEQTDISSVFNLGDSNETNYLLNELQILKSRRIASRTIEYLYKNHKSDNLIILGMGKPEYTFLGSLARNILSIFKEKKDLSTFENFVDSGQYEISVAAIIKGLNVINPRKTDILKVSFTLPSAEESALVLNTVVNEYQKNDQQWAAGELIYLDAFLNESIIEKEIELETSENKLMEYQEKNNIFTNSEINNLLLVELTEIESDYFKTIAEKNIESKRKEFYLNQLNNDEKELTAKITSTLNIQLESMRNTLSKLETELVSTKASKGENHPAAEDLELKIEKLKKDLAKDTRKYINEGISSSNPLIFRQTVMDTIISISAKEEVLFAKERELQKLTSQYNDKIKSLPSQILQLSRLKRNQAILDETYKVMKRTLEETKITKASELGRVRIIDLAEVPLLRSSPGINMYIIAGIVLGLSLGIIIIGIRKYFDNSVNSVEEIERRGLSVIGIIPEFEKDETHNERYIALESDSKSIVSESYRNIRTGLMVSSNIKGKEKCKTILVSSPGPKEGKSTTSSNLAIAYAQTGKKVLFMDLDLRKPVVHKIFNAKKEGLSNYLSNVENSNINQFIQKSSINNLSILSVGPVPPNPSEILSSILFKKTFDDLKEKFDVIIVDSAPFIAVTDSYIISKYVSHTVLVVRSNQTDKSILDRVLNTMNQQDISISGVVLNGIKFGDGYYGSYYYNSYYQYYRAEED